MSQSIPAEIAIRCDILDRAIPAFITGYKGAPEGAWRYEAHVEALNLFILTVRHIEGTILLARTDLILLPPAMTAVRAAFEASVQAAWLVSPADQLTRETRYVAHLKRELDYIEKQRRMLDSNSGNTQDLSSRAAQISSFVDSLSAKLAEHGHPKIPKVPNFRELLASIGNEHAYLLYNWLSQYMHSTHASTWLYRTDGLGTERRFEEASTVDDWVALLGICRFAMDGPATLFLKAIGADSAELATLVS